MDQYAIIEAAERQLAREVTLGAIIERPPATWQYLIPGMFVVDFFRRQAAIRRFTQVFMFPRLMALEAARALEGGQSEAQIGARIENDVRAWLQARNLDTDALLQALKSLVLLLTGHYAKMRAAEGSTHSELIASSYPSRDGFEEFIRTLETSEGAVDAEIIKRLADHPKLIAKMKAEERQIAMRRRRLADEIY